MVTRRVYRRHILRGSRSFWGALASPSGVVDLASVMVGVIIFAVLGTITVAAFVTAVPWAQSQESTTTLNNVRTAESASRIATGSYQTAAGLINGGFLPTSKYGSSSGPGLPNAGVPLTTVGNNGACYVAAVRTQGGLVYWLSSGNPVVQTTSPTSPAPDTSACTAFPAVANFPYPPLTLNYDKTVFDSTQGGQHLTSILAGGDGAKVGYSVTSGTLAAQLSLDPNTGIIAGPASPTSWPTHATGATGAPWSQCVTMSDTTVDCWGRNQWGQLGNGTTNTVTAPAPVLTAASTPLTGAKKVVMSDNGTLTANACAVMNSGQLYCWGNNSLWQLGDGTGTQRNYAQPVLTAAATPLTGIVDVSMAEEHTCALSSTGKMYCWGHNSHGELGNGGTSSTAFYATQVAAVSGVTAIAAGEYTTCAAVGTTGYCWGDDQTSQTLGGGAMRTSPTVVAGLPTSVSKISVGTFNACALLTSGTTYCWGLNQYHQLSSTATPSSSTSAIAMPQAGTDGASLTVGYALICVISTSGAIHCWGYGTTNTLFGDGTSSPTADFTAHSPTGIAGGAISIGLATNSVCAVLNGGSVKCWGENSYGELGQGTSNGTIANTPQQVPTITGLTGYPNTVTITATPTDGTPAASKTMTITVQ